MGLITFWHWLGLAAVLILLRLFTSGGYWIWMGISAAGVAGILFWVPDLGWKYQLILFSVFSIVSIALWRRYAGKNPQRPQSS